MTLDDDLFAPTTAATPNVTTKRCGRHDWGVPLNDQGASPSCRRCGKPYDFEAAVRNKRNRSRGGAFERSVAKRLGGRRTGPLGGRDDVIVGALFSVQTKRAARFSLTAARSYLADLRRIYPTRIPLVVHALPGERGGVVIVGIEDWIALHGTDGQEAT